jgi:hypothetical protein
MSPRVSSSWLAGLLLGAALAWPSPGRAEPAGGETNPGVWAVVGVESAALLGTGLTAASTREKRDLGMGLTFLGTLCGGVGLGVGSHYGGWDNRIAYGVHGGMWGLSEGVILGSMLFDGGDKDAAFGHFGTASVLGGLVLGTASAWAQVAVTDDWEDFAWTAGSQAVCAGVGGLVVMIYALSTAFSCSSGDPDCGASSHAERKMAWIMVTSSLVGHAAGLLGAGLRDPAPSEQEELRRGSGFAIAPSIRRPIGFSLGWFW